MITSESIITTASQNNFLDSISNMGTHCTLHKVSEVESMNRTMLSVADNSTFNPDVDINSIIQTALISGADELAEWLNNSAGGDTYGLHVRVANNSDDPFNDYCNIGSGFNFDPNTRFIREYTTDTVNVVVRNTPQTPAGFTLVTAYPLIADAETCRPTGRNLNDIMAQTDMYQHGNTMQKAYQLYRTDPRNTCPAYINKTKDQYGNEEQVIWLYTPGEKSDEQNIIRISEKGATMMTKRNDPTTGMNYAVPSVYTEARDKEMIDQGKTPFKHLTVRLNQPAVRELFFKNHPDMSKSVSAVIKHIKNIQAGLPYDTVHAKHPHYTHEQTTADKAHTILSQPQSTVSRTETLYEQMHGTSSRESEQHAQLV